jgi:ketol-acid reductoisomerase
MDQSKFADGIKALKGKKVVIVGCGAQGLNQGLNMRDSGLYFLRLRADAIAQKSFFMNAADNGFKVGNMKIIPTMI